jgi:hypothetical protein
LHDYAGIFRQVDQTGLDFNQFLLEYCTHFFLTAS